MKTLGHRVKRSWVSSPSYAIPGLRLTPRPRESKPPWGTGAFPLATLFNATLSYIPCVASLSAQLGRHFFIKNEREDKDRTVTRHFASLFLVQTTTANPPPGSNRNFDTNPLNFGALESCDLICQKLEASFEKYEPSPPEVNRTIVGPPFCKH